MIRVRYWDRELVLIQMDNTSLANVDYIGTRLVRVRDLPCYMGIDVDLDREISCILRGF